MDEHFHIFFSNRLEVLYQKLKASLFHPGMNPFVKRLIVVYGPAMKNWLMLKMAQDPELSIAFGIEFVTLSQAFDRLFKLTSINIQQHIPTLIELQIGIDHQLHDIIQQYHTLDSQEQQEWLPLFHYLKIPINDMKKIHLHELSKKTKRRLTALNHQLATIFQRYGRYAGAMVSEWEQSSLSSGWQSRLWCRLFGKNSPYEWTYPARLLNDPIHLTSPFTSIHFFSISFITSCEFAYLRQLTTFLPVNYYLLSPCAMFWSDLRTDREVSTLQSFWQKRVGADSPQLEQLEEYLTECNPLLANFGRLGREMAQHIEKSETQTHSHYIMNRAVSQHNSECFEEQDFHFEETSSSLSLLQAVQSDLLLMRTPQDHEPFCAFDTSDHSIQIHIAPNCRREIEILVNQLLQLIDNDSTLTPSDILVMAPNIEDYVPYIQHTFNLKNTPLDCQILDVGHRLKDEPFQGLNMLISLAESRWEATQLLEICRFSPFLRKQQLSNEDVDTITDWIEQGEIRWGENAHHRNELMRERHCQNEMTENVSIGTWEHGIDRLLNSLIQFPLPLTTEKTVNIEFSKADLLGKWITLLQSLRDDLRPFTDETEMNMRDWVHYIQCLMEHYFQPSLDKEMEESYHRFNATLETLKASATKTENTLFSFIFMKAYLMQILEEKEMIYRDSHLQAVRFCSLIPLRSIPAKVIALIGMDECHFPRLEIPTALNLMHQRKDVDYCPTSSDFDRYLFLEALHSAQEHLIISYSSHREGENKTISYSPIIQELIAYFDRCYTIDNKLFSECRIFNHPFDSFSLKYFDSTSHLPNYSQRDYLAAQAFSQPLKNPPYTSLSQFHPPKEPILHNASLQIDLKQLNGAMRNPIKLYINKNLEIYLEDREDRTVKVDEPFILSPLDQAILQRSAIQHSLKCVVTEAEERGTLPLGLFRDVAINRLSSSLKQLNSTLNSYNIDLERPLQLQFCPACIKPEQIKPSFWRLPAPKFVLEKGTTVTICGTIDHALSEGLLKKGTGVISDIWEAWPSYLLYCHAVTLIPDTLSPTMIFVKEDKIKIISPPSLKIEDSLKQISHYHHLCLNQISPLVSTWIPYILNRDPKGLHEKILSLIEDSFDYYQDPYLKWCFNTSTIPDTKDLIDNWEPYLQSIFPLTVLMDVK